MKTVPEKNKITGISAKIKVVALGGGTGLPVVLRGFKSYPVDLTAVVTVTDDGGSSGRLRGELGVIPPGDIRNCLLSLADAGPAIEELFNYRFTAGSELQGHSLGNLLITVLCERFGPKEGLFHLEQILAVRGNILPLTTDDVQLQAFFPDGNSIIGETKIVSYPALISRLMLNPDRPAPFPGVVEAITGADILIIGPGSLYTSILPHLLVKEVKEAVQSCRGTKYYVCNVMTQPGETDGFTAGDHIQQIINYGGSSVIDKVVVNTDTSISPKQLQIYSACGSVPVAAERITNFKAEILKGAIINKKPFIRHSSESLARIIWEDYCAGKDQFKEEPACRMLP